MTIRAPRVGRMDSAFSVTMVTEATNEDLARHGVEVSDFEDYQYETGNGTPFRVERGGDGQLRLELLTSSHFSVVEAALRS